LDQSRGAIIVEEEQILAVIEPQTVTVTEVFALRPGTAN
jgi:hypothetical protein